VIVRYLEYIVALDRERHFARAAAACKVTQPTLSSGIKQFEKDLGVLIVERGQRFAGFTPEGHRVLAWARRILADYRGLEQEVGELREGLVGQLRIGAIPVGLPALGILTAQFTADHTRARIEVISQTSAEIQRGLDDFAIDVGMTYLDNDPLSRVRVTDLYDERYVLVSRADGEFQKHTQVTWAQAAGVPLCLLNRSMQNRRILDTYFHAAGVEPTPMIETNSLVTLWSHVRFGRSATVVPHTFLLLLGQREGLLALPLVDPIGKHAVGLVASSRDPLTPMTRELLNVARQFDLAAAIEREIRALWQPKGAPS